MRLNVRVALVALMIPAVGALRPADARADIRGWTMCTPGAFKSCQSISITTNPIMTGPIRTGTAVTIMLTNLQGSGFVGDNTTLSGLNYAFFAGRNFAFPLLFNFAPHNATMTGAGASGSLNWYSETGSFIAPTGYQNYVANYPVSNGVLGGCASGNVFGGFYTTTANTCGATAFAVFTFNDGNIFDARHFETAYINSFSDTDQHFCFSDPAKYDPSFPTCDVYADYTVVAPEPVTMALLGTGLLGLGGVRLRRKKKDVA